MIDVMQGQPGYFDIYEDGPGTLGGFVRDPSGETIVSVSGRATNRAAVAIELRAMFARHLERVAECDAA